MPQPTFTPPQLSTPPTVPVDPTSQLFSPPPPKSSGPPTPVSPLSGDGPKRGGRLLLMVGILVIGVMLVGGGAFAYLQWQKSQSKPAPTPTPVPVPSPVVENPDTVLAQAFANFSKVQSSHQEFDVVLNAEAKPGSAFEKELANAGFSAGRANITMQVVDDVASVNPIHASGVLKFSIPLKTLTFALEIAAVTVDGQNTYFQIQRMPSIPGVDFSSIENQWVKANPEEIKKEESVGQLQRQKISELYLRNPFLKGDKVEPGDTLDGIPMRRVTFTFDQAKFKAFLGELLEYAFDAGVNQLTSTSTDPAMANLLKGIIQGYVNTFVAQATLTGEMLIGQQDGIPRKLHADVTAPVPDTNGADGGTVTITLDARLSKVNELITAASPPTNYISTEEFMQQMEMLASPKTTDGSSSLDFDGDGLTDAVEQELGTDPAKPDTDGDGYTDGNEVKNGYNPLGPGKLSLPEGMSIPGNQ